MSTLKFAKNEFLSHIVNVGIGSAFSKSLGSALSEGLDLDPFLLYKAYLRIKTSSHSTYLLYLYIF